MVAIFVCQEYTQGSRNHITEQRHRKPVTTSIFKGIRPTARMFSLDPNQKMKIVLMTKNVIDCMKYTFAERLAQLVEHHTSVREVTGSSPGQTNMQCLKIIEKLLSVSLCVNGTISISSHIMTYNRRSHIFYTVEP